MNAEGIALGDAAPELELPDTEGYTTTLPEEGEANAVVVVWTCNHCPYALAWHDRITSVARDYAPRGVRFVAVNSNDAERYPSDSPEAMAERYEAWQWGMPYVFDETQETARSFGAQTTPDLFVFDGDLRLRYRGAPDADPKDASQEAAWLRAALDAVLEGEEPEPAETKPVGCSIKWKV